MTDVPIAGSFRDPHGQVFTRGGLVHRLVTAEGARDYEQLMGSGLYDALVSERLLVEHAEVDDPQVHAVDAAVERVLLPAQVPFISYPWEWCPGQLRAAALATLRAQELALDHGMSLRDASAFNVQFLGGRPVLIDTSSFGVRPEGDPWVAYRQFCQHFLAPLALACIVDVRLLGLLRAHLDGLPLDLAATLLPARTKLRPGLAVHLHAHARSQRRHADDPGSRSSARGRFSLQSFRGLVDSLRGAVSGLEWEPQASAWNDYYDAAASYAPAAAQAKESLVGELLDEIAPDTVWDLGANTGRFSRLAAARGATVVALEADPSSVETCWRQLVAEEQNRVLPLVCDLTNPTPATGWAHRERMSLVERGPADCVLALALVHHLAIGGNVPLPHIMELCARLGRWLVMEFVPKDDPMVQRLLATREDVFSGYTQAAFEAAADVHYDLRRQVEVPGSTRTLYLLQRR